MRRPRSIAARIRRCREADRGYVLPLVTLLLLPLIAFTGLAVDLGAWQARAAAAQRAADAASLAGVSYLPSEQNATAAARAVAARNGFVHGIDNVTVNVENLGSQNLRVTVSDGSVDQYFTNLFTDEVAISRSATAEYVLPVALGSPRNFLGTGNLAENTSQAQGMPGLPTANAENYWLSINGPCSSREQGDWRMPISNANFVTNNPPPSPIPPGLEWRGCRNASVDIVESHDPNGYYVGFKVPETFNSGSFTVQVFDASRCNHANAGGVAPNVGENGNSLGVDHNATGNGYWTRYRVLDANDTPFDPTNNTTIAERTFDTGAHCHDGSGARTIAGANFACGAGRWSMRWCDLHTITNPVPGGVYFLQVDAGPIPTGNSNVQHMLNSYSVRVRTGGTFSACSSDPNDSVVAYSNQCVQVFGFEWLSVFANLTGSEPSFYLAEIGPEHSNKTMEVSLYDIGEGTVGLQLLDPLGTPVAFDWRVIDESGSDATPTGGWSGQVGNGGTLDVRGNAIGNSCGGGNTQASGGRISSSKYNDRFLQLNVDLPIDIQAAYGGNTWWRVRYSTCDGEGAAASDRTTWGVIVRGDPVRLIE